MPRQLNSTLIDEYERLGRELLGRSLNEQSDLNVLWMRENGFDNVKTQTEKHRIKEKGKRIAAGKERRQEIREAF